jgi:hypothetical protein
MSVPAALIPYADQPSRWGVAVDRSSEMLRLVVSPVSSVLQLSTPFKIWAIVIIAIELFLLWLFLFQPAIPLEPVIAHLCIWGFVLCCMAVVAWERMTRRVVFEITSSRLAILRLAGSSRVIQSNAWPRDQVGRIRYNVSNGKLAVWITGKDVIDVYVRPNRALVEWVAGTLGSAMREIPIATHEHPLSPAIRAASSSRSRGSRY